MVICCATYADLTNLGCNEGLGQAAHADTVSD